MKDRTRKKGAGLLALGLFLAVAGVAAAAGEQAAAVEDRVAARLAQEKSLAELAIGIQVRGGTVHLSGDVKSLKQRDDAGRLAGKVNGVREVVNQLEVAPAEAKDLQLRKQVSEELLYYPYNTMFDSVEVGVEGGVAFLGGYVTQPWKKLEMEKRVKKVEGIRRIENRIEVLPTSLFDDQLRYTIARLLYRDGRFVELAGRYPAPVRFVVKNSNVTIEGVVVSPVDRRAIESLVRQGTLSLSVKNNLKTDREVRERETE